MAEEKKGTNAEYLHSLYRECLEDPDRELPKELRFFLLGDVDWDILYLNNSENAPASSGWG